MSVEQSVLDRAHALIERGKVIGASTPQYLDHSGRQMIQECSGWIASATNLIKVIYPDPTSSYQQMAIFALATNGEADKVGKLTAILVALLIDVKAGVVNKVADAVRAEVFDDFLDQAEHYLQGNKTAQAGVIAGVVFEDTIRKACEKRQIPQKGVELEQLISTLVKTGVLIEIKAKRARAAAGVRTKATHAQWDEFGRDDVAAAIKLTRELIDSLLI
ncbi:hypothetical protein [Variovorax terrae]|uniref:DUF4145 domain-containing protein n=1 Tax=Variovorax terrae TaxID=2923278 RepID=A0A9X2AMW2_9BURK|nr:hypothetical protein [Variovorax terrae]MCJ0764163.1 hypothetical protein [Variovorax terrae]